MSIRGEGPSTRALVALESGFVIGLIVHSRTSPDDRFDPARVGLDHLSWWVGTPDELEAWRQRAEELGAESSGLVEAPDGLYLNVKDPDGTALEFYVPAD